MKRHSIIEGDTLIVTIDTKKLPPGVYPIDIKCSHPNGVVVSDYISLEVLPEPEIGLIDDANRR